MSVVDTAIRWTRQLASRTAHALVHPVETASEVADLASTAASAAAATVGAAKEADRDPVAGSMTPQIQEPADAPEPVAAAEPFPPLPPVITEPKPSDVDDWRAEVEDLDDFDELDEGPGAGEEPDDDRPLLDPSVAKAVRSEAETMRHAAERNPERADADLS